MLGFNELEDIARLRHLSLKNAEKDYIQELILFSLSSHINRELIFKGGTCLYKIYKLDRFSEDLDFNLVRPIDLRDIVKKIFKDFNLLNIKINLKEFKEYKNEVNIRLLFNGPLYKGAKESQCFIPLNISLKEKISLDPRKEIIISLYKEIPNFEIFVMDEKEILAEKVRAILTREKARDVYDLWFLITKKNILFDMSLINRKLKLYNLKFDKKEFIKAIDAKKNLWDLDLRNLIIHELPDFSIVKKQIINYLPFSS